MEQTATGKDKDSDLLICGFWPRSTDYILDVRVTDTADAKSYRKQGPAKVLEARET